MYPHIKLRQQEMNDYIIYESWAPSDELMTFSYTASKHTGHMSTSNFRRGFVIDKEGLKHNKIVIKNEYGFIIGRQVPYHGHEWQGLIDIEGNHFGYILSKNGNEIKIYNIGNGNLILNCSLPVPHNGQLMIEEDTVGISLGLCWFSYLQQNHSSN
ncbi:MAG: hypothetical protein JSS67_01185 [Bacteroidetes bacterium]|nr:hypothetical protein [Bacteroidota bacterium]